ncbi:MAG: hypothetical protein H0U28_15980, partial [Nocardioidaceae bacterium]|nr:hypothetical protein [Nocardioidaceae bacterium]
LERVVPRHARRVWTAAAVAVLVLSLGGPLSGAGITAAIKVWLAVMHLTVGATLIPLMMRTVHQGAGPPPRGSAAAPVTTDRTNVGGGSR